MVVIGCINLRCHLLIPSMIFILFIYLDDNYWLDTCFIIIIIIILLCFLLALYFCCLSFIFHICPSYFFFLIPNSFLMQPHCNYYSFSSPFSYDHCCFIESASSTRWACWQSLPLPCRPHRHFLPRHTLFLIFISYFSLFTPKR